MGAIGYNAKCVNLYRWGLGVTGLFVPKTFRSQEQNTNFGRFVWTIRSLDDSFLGRFIPRTIRSLT